MNINERLADYKKLWSDIYSKSSDEFINYLCLSSFHSLRLLLDLFEIINPAKVESEDDLISFSASGESEVLADETIKEFLNAKLKNNKLSNIDDLIKNISRIYRRMYGEIFSDKFYKVLGFIEALSHLAKMGGAQLLKKISRDLVEEFNYQVFELEKVFQRELVKFRCDNKERLDETDTAKIKNLLNEIWDTY